MKNRWQTILVAIFLTLITVLTVLRISKAGAEGTTCYVFCDPDSFVTIRSEPKRKSVEVGGATFGSELKTDGKIRDGYLHVYELAAEEDDGWISTGYVVYDPPKVTSYKALVVSNGRLTARKSIGGKMKKMLRPMTEVKVFCESDEWCLTNYGYVMTEFLELVGE